MVMAHQVTRLRLVGLGSVCRYVLDRLGTFDCFLKLIIKFRLNLLKYLPRLIIFSEKDAILFRGLLLLSRYYNIIHIGGK